MDARLINPFLVATIHVLGTMANIKPNPGKPFIKKDGAALGDVSAIIGISGVARGSMALTFSESAIMAIVSNLLGIEATEVNEEVKDAVGELTNMICGDARRRLSEDGLALQGGIPTIVSGKNHSISHISNGPHLAIPFTTPHGGFVVEVAFNKD